MKAMLLAAGLGTRLKPFTDFHPKALALVNGKTLLQRNIEYLKGFGVDGIMINVHHFAEQIIQFLDAHHWFGIDIQISDERDEVLETGGGLLKAKWYFEKEKTPFVLMNADILTQLSVSDMLRFHKEHQPLATLAVSERKSSRHFLFNDQQQLCGWENTQTNEAVYSRHDSPLHAMAFSGIHIIEPQLFSFITQEGKFSMVDVYLDIAAKQSILGYDHTGIALIDAGKPESIVAAEKLFF